jgi:lysine 6-dehydrogenase
LPPETQREKLMKIVVIGAGRMGRAAVHYLASCEDVEEVGLLDSDRALAEEVSGKFGNGRCVAAVADASDEAGTAEFLADCDAAVSCVPFRYNLSLTRAAIAAGCHLVDLGGNNDVVRAQLEMDAEAARAGVVIVPDCGLAPGMVSILAADGLARFDRVEALQIRVGGLPQSPRPPLNYLLSFSTEGLLNEYSEPCLILEDGRKKTVGPMTGLEKLEFDGIGELEAFYTSGGVSTLPDTFLGKIDTLEYKTIRYPGHCRAVKAMLDIGLASRQEITVEGSPVAPRAVFEALLNRQLTSDDLDMVLVRVTVTGEKDGRQQTRRYEIIDKQENRAGLTAMMRMTAFPAAIVARMAASGQIAATGVKPQELVVKPSLFIPQLKKRGMRLTVTEDQAGGNS